LVRTQQRQLTQLRQAIGTLGMTLVERDPTLIPEFREHFDAFSRLEQEELPEDVEAREVWDSWITLKEQEILSGEDAPIQ
jgi:hypothetical protein